MLRSRLENQKRGENRIGQVADYGIAVLSGYTLKFNKKSIIDGSGKTNIMGNNISKVFGVIYELTSEQINLLDSIEIGYERSTVSALLEENIVQADTYFAVPKEIDNNLLPTRDYLNFLIRGAKEHTFPNGYVEFLEKTKVK